MSNEREAFINAIIEHPFDDLPRLVFADWLEETGDSARAEFIRVQCELAADEEGRGRVSDERRRELKHLEVGLLEKFRDTWLAEDRKAQLIPQERVCRRYVPIYSRFSGGR